jgi:hypothetical protein
MDILDQAYEILYGKESFATRVDKYWEFAGRTLSKHLVTLPDVIKQIERKDLIYDAYDDDENWHR